MNPPSGTQVCLRHADQELVFVEVGGGIRTYSHQGRDVIDGYGEHDVCSGGRGQFLAPWPNRLADGRFDWASRTHQLALSEPDHHNAIHGLVRWANWRVEALEASVGRATYRLHPQSGWAWMLDFSITYQVSEAGLEVTTVVTHVGPEGAGPCPIGWGWHPYLSAFGSLVDDSVVTLSATTAYTSDERGLPTGTYPTRGTDVDFASGRRIGAAVLDTAFTDLRRDEAGRAWVTLASSDGRRGAEMWLDENYSHLMVFSGDTLSASARRRGLAVEPMTCAPDALRSGDGLRRLDPGETLSATWGLAGGYAPEATRPSRDEKNSST